MGKSPKPSKAKIIKQSVEVAKDMQPVRQGRKKPSYSVELKTRAMVYWASGYSMTEVAKMIGLSNFRIIDRWKAQNMPCNWDEMRAATKQKQVVTEVKRAMATLEDVRSKQQDRFSKAQDIALAYIAKTAGAGLLNHEVAADVLFKSADHEQRLFLPLEVAQAPRGQTMSAAAYAKPSGELGVMVTLNQMFEEAHGRSSQPVIEQTSEPGQPPGLPDTQDV